MAKLLIVVGLPGSGKTCLLGRLKTQYQGLCVPDFHACAYGNSSRVTDSRYYVRLVEALRAGQDCAIADIAFCDSWRRVEIEHVVKHDVPGADIEWKYFENAPEKCKANVRKRGQATLPQELKCIDDYSRKYIIPEGIEPLPVWSPNTED